eukprot:UN02322
MHNYETLISVELNIVRRSDVHYTRTLHHKNIIRSQKHTIQNIQITICQKKHFFFTTSIFMSALRWNIFGS